MNTLLRHRSVFRLRTFQQSHAVLSSWQFYSSSSKPLVSDDFQNDPENGNSPSSRSNHQTSVPIQSNTSNYGDIGGGSEKEPSSWLDKVVYSSYLEKYLPPRGYRQRLREKFEVKELETEEMVGKTTIMPPVSLKYFMQSQLADDDANPTIDSILSEKNNVGRTQDDLNKDDEQSTFQFPYKISTRTAFVEEEAVGKSGGDHDPQEQHQKLESVAERLRKQEIDVESVLEESSNMADIFESAAEVCIADAGTPDPNVPPSNIPCGGCGALLHCQDQSIPGYISSEKFKKANKRDLKADVCYRCSVLEAHQATLNVNVSSEDYPRIVSKIREQFAMVLLMIDLTDFPCSIWPGILDIIGNRRPIILIGNKVDLLPQDSPDYLRRVEESLIKCAVDVGLLEANVIHTALISAKTGYGVENLITSIFNLCKGRGDLFIMGCTNVGKSSLFNTFLQSDLCKPQATDVVQKSTISQWPGTTLNLLKFPMTSPTGWRKFLRQRRLENERPMILEEEKERRLQLRMTGDPEHAILTGRVGKTFTSTQKQDAIDKAETVRDIFHVNPVLKYPPKTHSPGQWDPDDPAFSEGHWVYDTPGAVNSNQILDLLTLPELMQSLPKSCIQPRTFYVKPKMSFFIGGLARLDFVEGPHAIRFTLFSNNSLPVTMCQIEDADMVYQKALGTKIFSVPCGGNDRLSQFPTLESKSVTLDGCGHTHSCADIVLSSIGWIAVTAGPRQEFNLSVYTPNGKGIFIRQPSMLPYAVNFKGKRVRGTYSYLPHQVYTHPKDIRNQRRRV